MPLYDFRCDSCAEEFEEFAPAELNTNSGAEPRCPACGSGALTRQFASRIAVHTSAQRRGRVVDLSSAGCPCGGHRHAGH